MAVVCLVTEGCSDEAIFSATGQKPDFFLNVVSEQQSLRLYSNVEPFDQLKLSEARYRSFSISNGVSSEVGGALVANAFHADLELRVGIDLEPAIETLFQGFLANNPFMGFESIAVRNTSGGCVQYRGSANLSSRAFRDIRHELPTFALRSGAEVEQGVYTEVFNEDGRLLRYGRLERPAWSIAQAAIVFVDPATGRRFRACDNAEPLIIP